MTLEPRQFSFNTGRQYTPVGQVMTCHVIDGQDGFPDEPVTVLFHDHARSIAGRLPDDPNFNPASMTDDEISAYVLARYDAGNYREDFNARLLVEIKPRVLRDGTPYKDSVLKGDLVNCTVLMGNSYSRLNAEIRGYVENPDGSINHYVVKLARPQTAADGYQVMYSRTTDPRFI